MTYGHVFTDMQCKPAGVIRAIMCHVQHGAVLNIGPCPNPDNLHVASHRSVRPDADVVTQPDVSHDDGGRIDHDPIA